MVGVEEGALISKESLEVLIPTVRKEGSEIWITFNPDQETDEVYKRYVMAPASNVISVEMNYYDNPWFPDTLREEMESTRERSLDDYNWTWLGKPRRMLEGAVYASELRLADSQKRIGKVPYDPQFGVHVFCDLGWADMTALWFVQKRTFETAYISYYENQFKSWDHYIKFIQDKGYIIDTIWLPHDAKAKSLGTGKSIQELTIAKGFKTRIVPNLRLHDGLNAARTVFLNAYFDENECAQGLHALRYYRYEQDPVTKLFSKDPKHDQNSHGADGFRYSAVGIRAPKVSGPGSFFQKRVRDEVADVEVDEDFEMTGLKGQLRQLGRTATGWMGR